MQKYDPRNEDILIYIGGELLPRAKAKVSVFDSVVQGGDAVWEGIRVYDGRIFSLDRHLQRLQDSAKAMAFAEVPNNEAIKEAIFATLKANDMRDETHIRLTLTRGRKTTSGMDPRLNQFGPCLIVVAEWKPPIYDKKGISLISSAIRRNPPSCVDSKIHHNNLINNILAKVEANLAGVDQAIMLDLDGFVSEANATNIFMVKNGWLLTPFADSCLPGITRGHMLELAHAHDIPCKEARLSLSQFHSADEVFTTGTMGELSPVLEIDGRKIGSGAKGPFTTRMQQLYSQLTDKMGDPLPF